MSLTVMALPARHTCAETYIISVYAYITVTPKIIVYSDHAAGRLRERGITRQMVRRLLATGAKGKATTVRGAQRWEASGKLGRRIASIIYIESASEILVVTVQWLA